MIFKKRLVIFLIFFNVLSKNKIVDVKLSKNNFCEEIDIFFQQDPKFVRQPDVQEKDISKRKLLIYDTQVSKNLIKRFNQAKNKFFSSNLNVNDKNDSIEIETKSDEKKVLFRITQCVTKEGLTYLKFRFCIKENLEKNIKNSPYRLKA